MSIIEKAKAGDTYGGVKRVLWRPPTTGGVVVLLFSEPSKQKIRLRGIDKLRVTPLLHVGIEIQQSPVDITFKVATWSGDMKLLVFEEYDRRSSKAVSELLQGKIKTLKYKFDDAHTKLLKKMGLCIGEGT